MTSLGDIVSRDAIDAVVDRVVTKFNPKQVLLFGSYARGSPTEDSDVDLLITMETPLRPVEQAVAIRSAVQFPFPVDLLVRTPAQLAERLRLGDLFFQEILSEGIVLYEEADAGMDRKS